MDGHPRYNMLKYLSEGSFGFVVLAAETATKRPVRHPKCARSLRLILAWNIH